MPRPANRRSFRLRQLYLAQGGICARCTRRMNPLKKIPCGDMTAEPTIDHVYPKARGGVDCLSNMLAMCTRCNGRKGDAEPSGCDLIWLASVSARLGVDPFGGVISEYIPLKRRGATLADFWPL